MITPDRPYKLSNKIQRYAWGKSGMDSLIHRLLGTGDNGTLAAELWMGAHPNGPSEIDGKRLDEVIADDPGSWLGVRTAERFGNCLPFLFKVLSIRTALSIQAHPDRALAAELHGRDAEHYPDANHKPELAIAVSEVEVLYGFRTHAELRASFTNHAGLSALLSDDTRHRLLEDPAYEADTNLLQDICHDVFRASEADLRAAVDRTAAELRAGRQEAHEKWFLTLLEEYPGDVGLVCLFLLQFLSLKPGEAIFVGPNIPHAYLRGDLLECMANSDNVVRAGLTNKYKDVDTLLQMMHYRPAGSELLTAQPDASGAGRYAAPAKEFEVRRFSGTGDSRWELISESGSMIVCFQGRGKVGRADSQVSILAGESCFLPAAALPIPLTTQGGEFYFISVP